MKFKLMQDKNSRLITLLTLLPVNIVLIIMVATSSISILSTSTKFPLYIYLGCIVFTLVCYAGLYVFIKKNTIQGQINKNVVTIKDSDYIINRESIVHTNNTVTHLIIDNKLYVINSNQHSLYISLINE